MSLQQVSALKETNDVMAHWIAGVEKEIRSELAELACATVLGHFREPCKEGESEPGRLADAVSGKEAMPWSQPNRGIPWPLALI